MPIPDDESCAICKFYSDPFCMRYPPVPLFGSSFGQAGSGVPKLQVYWPEMKPDAWCGEFSKVVGPQPTPR